MLGMRLKGRNVDKWVEKRKRTARATRFSIKIFFKKNGEMNEKNCGCRSIFINSGWGIKA
jgi:hypothetical protein